MQIASCMEDLAKHTPLKIEAVYGGVKFDPQLRRLIAQAFAGNFDLKAVVSRVDAARARTRIVGADQLPQIDIRYRGSRTEGEEAQGGGVLVSADGVTVYEMEEARLATALVHYLVGDGAATTEPSTRNTTGGAVNSGKASPRAYGISSMIPISSTSITFLTCAFQSIPPARSPRVK